MVEFDNTEIDSQAIRARKIAHVIVKEIDRAYGKHGRQQWGRHEFWGVLQEEFEEAIESFRLRFLLPRQMRRIWQNIRQDSAQDELTKEIVQLAAMCFRYLETGDRYRQPAGGNKDGQDESAGFHD